MESSIFRTSLNSEYFRLTQMHSTDFDALYAVAKDPAIWAQHPESNRWQEAIFRRFFVAGLANPEGCFLITDKDTEQAVGSTRFYGFDHRERSIWLGYTFLARPYWGEGANAEIKQTQLAFLFDHVAAVYFEIGENNIRSQKALKKFGVEEIERSEQGLKKGNLEFRLTRVTFRERSPLG